MREGFRDFGPVPWWAWSGSLQKPEMVNQLKLMKNCGVDEFFIFAVYGLEKPAFLTEEWFEYVAFTLSEAEKLNMRVWIYDDLNWPSGTAGGHMTRNYPEYRLRSIIRRNVQLPPGELYSFELGYAPLRVFARQKGTPWKPIQLTDNFYLNETNETLELQVYAKEFFNYPPLTSRGTAFTWDQRGACDLLNPEAVKAWIGCIHEKYYARFATKFGTTIRGFFYDEPHCMPNYGEIPWTHDLDKKFQEHYGYDFLDFLPDFYENSPTAEKMRHDYWSLIAELSSNSFGKTLADWCEQHGVLSTGHCVYEEIRDQALRLCFNGEIHGILKHQSVPGMDLLTDNTPYRLGRAFKWYGSTPDVAPAFLFTAKQATSTGRFSKAKRIMAEAMGVCNIDEGLNREKMVYDWLSGCGISLLNENSFSYTLKGFLKRTASNKHWTQPWMKYYGIFSEYCRTMSIFATGILDTQIAVFTPEDTIRAGTALTPDLSVEPKFKISNAMVPILDSLMRNHLDFELLFNDILIEGRIRKGILSVPNMEIKVIILPQPLVLSEEIAGKLRKFIHSGGHVICIGCRPEHTPAGKKLDFSDIPLATAAKLPRIIRKLIHVPYALKGRGNEEIFSALRIVDGKRTLFLSNQGENTVEFKVSPSPDRAVAHTPGDDKEWNFLGDTVRLVPEQSVLLKYDAECNDAKPPISWEVPGKKLIEFDGPWDYELDRPNNAVCNFEIGLAPNEEKESPDLVRLWLPVSRDGGHDLEFSPRESPFFWLRGDFTTTDQKTLEDLSLVVEANIYDRVLLNGCEIKSSTDYELWDRELRRYQIGKCAKTGNNRLELRGKTSPDNLPERSTRIFPLNFLEPVVLHGNFAVEYDGNMTLLKPFPQKLQTGKIADQGFPNYVGDLILKRIFTSDTAGTFRLELSSGFFTAAEVTVNGKNPSARVWKPYLFHADTVKGRNELTLRLSGHLGALLRRAYGGRRLMPRSLAIGKVRLLA